MNPFLKISMVWIVMLGSVDFVMRADDWPGIRGMGRRGRLLRMVCCMVLGWR